VIITEPIGNRTVLAISSQQSKESAEKVGYIGKLIEQ